MTAPGELESIHSLGAAVSPRAVSTVPLSYCAVRFRIDMQTIDKDVIAINTDRGGWELIDESPGDMFDEYQVLCDIAKHTGASVRGSHSAALPSYRYAGTTARVLWETSL